MWCLSALHNRTEIAIGGQFVENYLDFQNKDLYFSHKFYFVFCCCKGFLMIDLVFLDQSCENGINEFRDLA